DGPEVERLHGGDREGDEGREGGPDAAGAQAPAGRTLRGLEAIRARNGLQVRPRLRGRLGGPGVHPGGRGGLPPDRPRLRGEDQGPAGGAPLAEAQARRAGGVSPRWRPGGPAMTEEEWRRESSIEPLMSAAFQHTSVRKVTLFACACCREVNREPAPEAVCKAIDITEQYRNGQVSRRTWRRAYQSVASARIELGQRYGSNPVGWDWYAVQAVCELFADAGYLRIPRFLITARSLSPAKGKRLEACFCAILRDVFGNPFRLAAFAPAWRTSTAVQLARQMYEAREFSAMPILADALQDAGCENAEILDHCRGSGPHVRGCWVVDLVLGKS